MAAALRRFLLSLDKSIQAKLSPSLRHKWNHPAGLKTIHFWCPVSKWGLVFAGMSDFVRPPEALSLNQSLSLAVTGSIWVRYCLVNRVQFGLSVNFLLGLTGTVQTARVIKYNLEHPASD